MPRDFHRDPDLYFDQQRENALASILPFVEPHLQRAPGRRVLEIGCGAGGVLKAFAERGAQVTGVDLNEPTIEYAVRRFGAEVDSAHWRFEPRDIYDIDAAGLDDTFDLIVMKDTIEHIHDQRRLLARLPAFMAPGGAVFVAFPPWQMPFGGHQQICEHRTLMRLPWIHLLPRRAYAALLRRYREPAKTIDALLEIKETGISIERFERIACETGHRIADRRLYLINPIYRDRYGLEPREQFGMLAAVPVLRDFLTTSAYYLLVRG
jgi:SAM-dependent methyltransferase